MVTKRPLNPTTSGTFLQVRLSALKQSRAAPEAVIEGEKLSYKLARTKGHARLEVTQRRVFVSEERRKMGMKDEVKRGEREKRVQRDESTITHVINGT